MKLFHAPGACSLSPLIVAKEAGLSLTLDKVDLRSKKTASGQDYRSISPKGYVPALLLDSGILLTEGPAIVQYLADQVPSAHLIPANGTVERYQVQAWLNFIATELHKTFSPLFNPMASDDTIKDCKLRLAERFAIVSAELEKTPFIFGQSFTVADAYLFVVLSWSHHVHVDLPERLKEYVSRIAERPAVREAIEA